jgi:formylglycine-generating enzyme required for sulfatase activity
LTEKTGSKYRLPSEAEWEYAARAGTTTTYPSGDEILITDAVFSDRKTLTAPLPKTDRSINRNKFRLYHMLGNVREWIADSWHDNYSGAPGNSYARITGGTNLRVVRGGSYQDDASALRSGARDKLASDNANKFTGFRVIQELAADEG